MKRDRIKARPFGWPVCLSVPQAALYLGVSKNTAYSWTRTGDLPVVRIGGRLLVPREALDKLLAAA